MGMLGPEADAMRVAAECLLCGERVLTASGLGSRAAERLRAHLRDVHPEHGLEPQARFAEVLLSFDLLKVDRQSSDRR